MNVREEILKKVNTTNWGKACNILQDIAFNVLTKKSLVRYLHNANKDVEECEGLDGVLLNGKYFDWKEYDYNYKAIINAYLDYFTDNELNLILGGF